MKLINVNSSNNGNYNVNLNGNTYFFRTYWNKYVNRWFLDFNDVTNEPIISGCAIVHRQNLFNNRPQLWLEIGEIWSFDLTGGDCEVRENLGAKTILTYFEPGEFETLFPNYNDQAYRAYNYIFSKFFTVV